MSAMAGSRSNDGLCNAEAVCGGIDGLSGFGSGLGTLSALLIGAGNCVSGCT